MLARSRVSRGSRAVTRSVSVVTEMLESRTMMSVTVDAGQTVRAVDNQVLGANVMWWDSSLNSAQTQQEVQAAGLTAFRMPAGSGADTFHFNDPPTYDGQGTAASMADFISSVNGVGMVTLDYGSGSPQEAAAFLAYLNGSPNNNTPLGEGQQWDAATNTWVMKDWKTAGFWAGLRAAAPLAQDDGLNFLRANHAAPFGIHYMEIGNEEYGDWEADFHPAAHDPATYVSFAKQFAGYADQIDPTVSIGMDSGSISTFNNWTANVLQQCAMQGFTPGFISDHSYMQEPGTENDATLLQDTVSDPNMQDPGNPLNWSQRAAGYRNLIDNTLGAAGANIELLATEFNSVSYNPGKQSTSLVNGLFVADSIGSILQTSYDGAYIWALRNSYDTGQNNSDSLYGWREGGDYGILGDPNGPAPDTGADIPYPTYFAEQLASKMIHNGDTVVSATSDDPTQLTAYAVRQANGQLDLLVINKNATDDLTENFQIQGFQPASQAQIWQYGKTQDTAQSQTADGQSALANFSANLALNGANFSYTFPSYSMTVMVLDPSGAVVPGPVLTPPTVNADSFSTTENSGMSIPVPGVLANDSSPDPINVQTHTDPAHGTLAINADGSFTYTPAANFVGVDSFTYTAIDTANMQASMPTTVNLTITATAVTAAPVAADDSFTTQKNTILKFVNAGVLENDTPAGALSVNSHTDPSHGNLTLNANGSFTYTPLDNFIGTDSFTYTVISNVTAQISTPATVSITVAASGQVPTAIALSTSGAAVATGSSVTFTAEVADASATGGRVATPAGNVTFFSDGAPIGTVPLDANDRAALSTTMLPAGTHNITATYAGDTTFASSSSKGLSETVTAPASTLVTIGQLGGKRLAPFTLPDGVVVTISAKGGTGTVFEDGNELSLNLSGSPALVIKTRGGGLSLWDVTVNGNLNSLVATTTTLDATMNVSGSIGTLRLAGITGVVVASSIGTLHVDSMTGTVSCGGVLGTSTFGTISGLIAAGQIRSLTAGDLTNAVIVSGANLGSDGALGGAGADADTYGPGDILTLKITGSVTSSFIGAGINPVDTTFGNSNDTAAGASEIHTLTIRGNVDAGSKFDASAFGVDKILGKKVVATTDPRFLLL